MKITIGVLVVLLAAVLGWAVYDHSSLTKQNDALNASVAKMRAGNVKQASIIKAILACSNATENAYKKDKTYVSVNNCIKTALSLR